MQAGMVKRNWFLLVSILALVLGLSVSEYFYLAGAATGLALALIWTYRALLHKEFGSDSLAALAIVAATLTGEWLAAAIISLMLASGRALEDWATGKSNRELKSLLDRAPRNAHRISEKGQVEDVALEKISVGDLIRVLSGEVIPIDGRLRTPAVLDESALTGEPYPVTHEVGDEVSSGVVNSGHTLELSATSTSEQSTYSNLIRLVRQASAESADTVRLANRWAVWFIPFTLIVALAVLIIGQNQSAAVAVLIAATP